MPMIRAHDELSIQLFDTDDQPPYMIHGKFVMEDDTDIMVKGTVGDDIDKFIIVPRRNIKVIYNLTYGRSVISARGGEPQPA
jgi:hypothetical protein